MTVAAGPTPAPPSPSDATLLADTADPAESFSVFYRRHVRGVLTFCAGQGLNAHDAADLTSEIFVAALAARHRFDGARRDSAVPWLRGIGANLMAGRRRRSMRERAAHARLGRTPIALTAQDLQEYAAMRDEVGRALEHIAVLPKEQRAAVVGRHLEHAEYLELAHAHGVSEQVVRQRVSRGLRLVRRRLLEEDR